MRRIAFIGLGNMGRPMAAHLAAAGFELTVHSRTRAKADAEAESLGLDLAVLRAAAAQFKRLARTGNGEKGIQAIAARYGLGGR